MSSGSVKACHSILGWAAWWGGGQEDQAIVGGVATSLCLLLHNYSLWRHCGQSADKPRRNTILQKPASNHAEIGAGGLKLEILARSWERSIGETVEVGSRCWRRSMRRWPSHCSFPASKWEGWLEKSESRKKRDIKFIFCFTTDKGRVEKMFIFFCG